MRGGTLNVPAIVGFSAAVEKTVQGLDTFHRAVEETRRAFLDGISALDGVQVNGDERYRLGAVLSLSVDGVDNATLLYRLDLDGLCVAAGSACASASVKPSHVLTAMGMTEERARQTVRISFGRQNTAAEGARAAEIFVNAVKSLRKN